MTDTVKSARRNGSVGAPMPLKTVEIACDDAGYPGWHATLRTNVTARIFDDFASLDQDRFWRSLVQIVVDWNFADTDGHRLPTPREGLEWSDLPYDLASFLVVRYLEAFNAAAQVPKASAPSSGPTLPIVDGRENGA